MSHMKAEDRGGAEGGTIVVWYFYHILVYT